jgi:hypothetical protein
MRLRVSSVIGLCFAVLLSFGLTFNVAGKDKAAKMSNVQGRVQMIDKASSTITVEKGVVRRQVIYNADTKFLYGHSKDNKPGSADQVKDGNYISCAGTLDGTKLTAKECIYRESK